MAFQTAHPEPIMGLSRASGKIQYNIVLCKYCNRPFRRALKRIKGRKASGVRGYNSINCSKQCSRNYSYRIRGYIK